MLRIMILISHEEYANIQHVMLYKLLFAEIVNYIPANEFNKIVMNASKKEVDQARDEIEKIKDRKKILNQKYSDKKEHDKMQINNREGRDEEANILRIDGEYGEEKQIIGEKAKELNKKDRVEDLEGAKK